ARLRRRGRRHPLRDRLGRRDRLPPDPDRAAAARGRRGVTRRRGGDAAPFVRAVELDRDAVPSFDVHPFDLPAVRTLDRLELRSPVTVFVGENGTGKSTLLEAIAVACGFNAEGGSTNFRFATRESHSALHACLRV